MAMLKNKKNKTVRSAFRLRDRFVTEKGKRIIGFDERLKDVYTTNNFYNNKPWLRKCPKSVKQSAMHEAKQNYETCWTNFNRGNIQKFFIRFKSKKEAQKKGWVIGLEKANIKKENNSLFIFKTLLGEMRYYNTKQLHKLIPNSRPLKDCKIQKSKFGEYFLIVPYTVRPKKQASTSPSNPVSCDTGIRKYVTTYAPNAKESFMLGNRWSTDIMQCLVTLDNLCSEKSKEKDPKKICKLNKRMINLRKKVYYKKQELKYQIANFLVKRYDMVMIPKLDSKKLTIKAGRRLKTKVARQLMNAGHSDFFNILKDKCWEHGVWFLHCREEYTSQTCPECGQLNKCNEVYHCKKCGFSHDRDIVGAMNIMLKGVRTVNPRVTP